MESITNRWIESLNCDVSVQVCGPTFESTRVNPPRRFGVLKLTPTRLRRIAVE